MKQMQGLDAAFVAFEQQNAPIHIGSILVYDPSTAAGGFVRFKNILNFIKGRLHLAPVMRRRMVKSPLNIDYPYWIEDPKFDLEYHVRHVALPKPGDWRQLCILAARNFARPLDLDRPPWEILVVEGLDNIEGFPKGSYAMLTKMHHAAIDGASGVDLMHALHTISPEVDEIPSPDPWKPEKMPGQLGMLTRGYFRAITSPLRQAKVAMESTPGMARAAVGAVKGDFDITGMLKTPRTRFNNVISPHRIIEGEAFKLSDVKAMRAMAPGSTVNDIVLSIIGGAMRTYLEQRDELPDETLSAMAPISVRQEQEKNTMGNQVSAMRAPLGTHIEDASERVAYVHDETQKSKAMANALGARQMTEMSKLSPALFMGLGARAYSQWGLANRMKPMFNTVVTNVPGPPVPIYSCGAKLLSIYGNLCLLDGVGVGHVVQSYVDELTIGVTACREAMPDPENYMDHMRASFEAHQNAAADASEDVA
ncbi:MAG: diacylglycerol O-acyltransferase [Hyphococcus sp.]|nr:MAG: diacylglycerol O-acyltransferase [Marinicaulis sp.]